MRQICVLTSVLCALISAIVLLPGAQAPQRAGAQPASRVYLPFVAGTIIAPQLQAPAKGATLTTLAPLLSFTPLITGTHRIEISTTDAFTTTVFSTTLNLRDAALPPVTRPVNSNLDDSMRFFWRVEVIQGSTTVFSEARIFVTPAKSATLLPPKPILDGPPDGATVPTSTLTLSWKPVIGAIYYRVTVNREDGGEFASGLLDGKTTTLDLVNVPAGLSLNWKVKVLTATGWSLFAGPISFKTQ